jgi:peptidoglycan/LPS O-acetylase OafA/YrhL
MLSSQIMDSFTTAVRREPRPPADATRHSGAAEAAPRFYLPQLDGLRFFAFFAVFIHHSPLVPPEGALGTLVIAVRVFGWAGVDLFLCLSGFLITRLLMLEWDHAARIRVGLFYARRSLRIWPLYFLVIGLVFLLLPALDIEQAALRLDDPAMRIHFWAFVTFLGNWSIAFLNYPPSTLLSPLWTISLEEQFYLAWPWIVLLTVRRRWSLVRLCVGMIAFGIACRVLHIVCGPKHPFIWASTFCHMDSLALGSALGAARVDRWFERSDPRRSLLWALAGVALATLVVTGGVIETQDWSASWQYTLTAAASGCFLLSVLAGGPIASVLGSRALRYGGKISYGLYVYHYAVIAATKQLHGSALTTFSVSLVATLVVASASYELFEKPILKAKERFAIVRSRAA